ncbi:ricin-type beta-trefoil lectin domain protein [Streptomyces sp. NPDC046860]|uniref:ricin-type beta-trefoil lectin domain protein n=1 Tax=Streptomyces sp. NPDC046860 TaxID=3154495 RepID=UPI0033D8EAD8
MTSIKKRFAFATALGLLALSGVPTGTAVAAPTAAQPEQTRAPQTFAHPGVNITSTQLEFVRTKVQQGASPWKGAYDAMINNSLASLSRVPKPRADVNCGQSSNPNNGCTDERQDAIAAYTDALAWSISGDERYAKKAIQIMDAWSWTITKHTGDNTGIQTAWSAASWVKAAELMKYQYGNWPNAARFANMLRTVYLPVVVNGDDRTSNWDLTEAEASIGIAVFTDDGATFDKAVDQYLERVPAFVYLESDGPTPNRIPNAPFNWEGATQYVTGMAQETCRDFVHTGYSIASMSHIAETALMQNVDLYPQVGERLRQVLGWHATQERRAVPEPAVCGTKGLKRGLGPVTESGFNALHTRQGVAMANTQALTEETRPSGTNILFVAWETLTNAENPVMPDTQLPKGPITGLGDKCVDVAEANSTNTTPVQMYTCNGTAAQTWTVGGDGTLRSLGKCIDVPGAATADGTKVQLFDCNGTDAQVWQKGTGDTLVNKASGKCLDVTDMSTADAARLQIWTCTGNPNQQFHPAA